MENFDDFDGKFHEIAMTPFVGASGLVQSLGPKLPLGASVVVLKTEFRIRFKNPDDPGRIFID